MTLNDLVDEVDGEERIEDVICELGSKLDQVRSPDNGQRHQKRRCPESHPRVHGEERETCHRREAVRSEPNARGVGRGGGRYLI